VVVVVGAIVAAVVAGAVEDVVKGGAVVVVVDEGSGADPSVVVPVQAPEISADTRRATTRIVARSFPASIRPHRYTVPLPGGT
jgi:hypothetical protein